MNSPSETETALHQAMVAILAPAMALGSADPALAQQAAREAIAGYTAAGATNLIEIARSISLSMFAIDTLRLSADPGMAPAAKLKMRNAAAAQARTARQLAAAPRVAEPRPHVAGSPAPEVPVPEVTLPETPADVAEQRDALAKLHALQAELAEPEAAARAETEPSQAWANAMARVAADCAKNLEGLPLPSRRLELVRVTALTDAASHMMRHQDRRRANSPTASRTAATTPTITVAKA